MDFNRRGNINYNEADMKKILFPIIALLIFTSCAYRQHIWESNPKVQDKKNDVFWVGMGATCGQNQCNSFMLNIVNRTNEDLELIWDKTLYVKNGHTSGGFMFEGIVYKDRNNPKPADIIFANEEFVKVIWPTNLVYFDTRKYGGGWKHANFPIGENGIYLTIKANNRELHEKLTVSITRKRIH